MTNERFKPYFQISIQPFKTQFVLPYVDTLLLLGRQIYAQFTTAIMSL